MYFKIILTSHDKLKRKMGNCIIFSIKLLILRYV